MTESRQTPEIVVVTGMSGAGRSTAADALEDHGWYVVENIPPPLLPALLDLVGPRPELGRLALAVDTRDRTFFNELTSALEAMRERGAWYTKVTGDGDVVWV